MDILLPQILTQALFLLFSAELLEIRSIGFFQRCGGVITVTT